MRNPCGPPLKEGRAQSALKSLLPPSNPVLLDSMAPPRATRPLVLALFLLLATFTQVLLALYGLLSRYAQVRLVVQRRRSGRRRTTPPPPADAAAVPLAVPWPLADQAYATSPRAAPGGGDKPDWRGRAAALPCSAAAGRGASAAVEAAQLAAARPPCSRPRGCSSGLCQGGRWVLQQQREQRGRRMPARRGCGAGGREPSAAAQLAGPA